jgi:acyl-CoA synthetase (AMP-forming)/AMP-acid ligase II
VLAGLAAASTDVANILYTSGTTGYPKGAMQTQGNLVFNAGTVGSMFRVSPDDRTLVVAPMFHATGLASQLIGFGAYGAACIFQPRFRPADMLNALVEHRITFFAGVTAMIHLMLLDRMKDMIIRGGENIYSLEVESVIARHPAVAEVAAVGGPDAVFGERVRAVAVLREDASLSIAALREWAGTQLADYKLPAELITVDELPRNASGKVIKKQLAALLTETPPASASR